MVALNISLHVVFRAPQLSSQKRLEAVSNSNNLKIDTCN